MERGLILNKIDLYNKTEAKLHKKDSPQEFLVNKQESYK